MTRRARIAAAVLIAALGVAALAALAPAASAHPLATNGTIIVQN